MSDESNSGTEAAKQKPAARKTRSTTTKKKPAARKTAAAAKTTTAKAKASPARKPRATAAKKTAALKTDIVPVSTTSRGEGFAEDSRARASELANDTKHRISDAIANLGGLIGDSAGVIEERLGSRFGDMARSTSDSVTTAAKRVDESDLSELAEDTRQFVRKSPAIAIGLAATAGFVIARLFKSASNKD